MYVFVRWSSTMQMMTGRAQTRSKKKNSEKKKCKLKNAHKASKNILSLSSKIQQKTVITDHSYVYGKLRREPRMKNISVSIFVIFFPKFLFRKAQIDELADIPRPSPFRRVEIFLHNGQLSI